MKNRYFRAGVGTVVYFSDNRVAWFKRNFHPVGIWQFQQGGIDIDESVETTLWRELLEEVGLTQDNIELITEYPKWTVHVYPYLDLNKSDNPEPDRLGQVHRWFFLKLKEGVEINLEKATEDEFSAWEWTDFDTVVERTSEDKRPAYEELREFYNQNLKIQ